MRRPSDKVDVFEESQAASRSKATLAAAPKSSPCYRVALNGLKWLLLADLARWIWIQPWMNSSQAHHAFPAIVGGACGLFMTALLLAAANGDDPVIRGFILTLSALSFPLAYCLFSASLPQAEWAMSLHVAAKALDIGFALLLFPFIGGLLARPFQREKSVK